MTDYISSLSLPEIVFLFGAGASKGAGAFMPEAPPLGGELFGELKRCFPQSWGCLPNYLTAEFKKEPLFERGMALLWKDYSRQVPQLMQHMCLYFIQFRPRQPGTTLYCKLVSEIAALKLFKNIAISTINYDCLIEHSISSTHMAVNYFSVPSNDNTLALWKLHGSCNFWPDQKMIRATRCVSFSKEASFGAPIEAHSDLNDSVAMCLGDNALPPVMCLFMPGKPTQVSPNSIAAIQELWAKSIQSAQKVIIIGVAPNKDDVHIWEPLMETNAALYYSDYDDRMAQWCQIRRESKTSVFLGKDFQACYDPMMQLLRGD